MRKNLLIVFLLLSCLSINAQQENDVQTEMILIEEKDWSNVEYIYWWDFEVPDWSYETTDKGLAITNPSVREQNWIPKTVVTDQDLSLEEGHDYIVRLTLKVPSDGTYWMYFGSWDVRLVCEVPVTASDDFQIIDIDFSSFVGNTWRDGFVILGNGWVAGTTVLKKVQVYERRKGGETAMKTVKTVKGDDAIYNLAGQKVDASYKGIVIQNGKKHIARAR